MRLSGESLANDCTRSGGRVDGYQGLGDDFTPNATTSSQLPVPFPAGLTVIAASAIVSARATVSSQATVWHGAQIREGAVVEAGCVIGQGVYIGPGVNVGANCRIQNGAQIFDPAILEPGVFVGPGCILTNDRTPRAITPEGYPIGPEHWTRFGVTIRTGASLGAGAICIAPVQVGSWAMIAAGAVVTRDVPEHALVAGVPARFLAWVCACGFKVGESWEAAAAVECGRCGRNLGPFDS